MDVDHKAVVKQAVRKYLEQDHPDRLEEFEFVFEDVYGVIQARIESDKDNIASSNSEAGPGIPFDSGAVVGTVISVACWITACVTVATLKYAGKDLAEDAIRRVADECVKRGADRAVVDRIRDVLVGIMNEF